MIERIWRGWTTHRNADPYEALLRTEIFPAIAARGGDGYRGIRLLRRDLGDEVEFCTIMTFDDIDAVRRVAGEDHEVAYVPDRARAILSRFEACATHYELRDRVTYPIG